VSTLVPVPILPKAIYLSFSSANSTTRTADPRLCIQNDHPSFSGTRSNRMSGPVVLPTREQKEAQQGGQPGSLDGPAVDRQGSEHGDLRWDSISQDWAGPPSGYHRPAMPVVAPRRRQRDLPRRARSCSVSAQPDFEA
jgi:hypothetical protein